MDRYGDDRALSRYRGLRLTLTQGHNGTIVWNLHAKAQWARWSDWEFVAGGTVSQHEELHNEREVVDLLLNVLEERRAYLSGRP